MQLEENKDLVRRGYEALGKGDWTFLRKVCAPNFVDHSPVQGQAPGPDGFIQSRMTLMSALSGFRSTIEDIVAEGDKVAVRLTNSCTHRGEVWGLPPTNKRVTYTETTIWRTIDGCFTDRWCNTDTLSLMQQLGGIPVR